MLVVLASLVVVACSNVAGGDGTNGSASTGGNDPVSAPPGGGGDTNQPTDGALHVVQDPSVRNPHPTVWDRLSLANDGRTLTIYFYGGVEDCYGLHSVDVSRDADGKLVIKLAEGVRPAAQDKACIDIAVLKAVTVTLDEPLAEPVS